MKKLNKNDIELAWKFHESAFNKKKCPIKKMEVKRYKNKNDELVIYKNKEYIIFVFAPTNDFKDILDDLNASKFIDFYMTHKGFQRSANRFNEIIKTEMIYNKKVLVIGKSKGGAIATLIAKFIALKLKKESSCIVFGSPKAGGINFANFIRNTEFINHAEVYFKSDIVTKLPTNNMGYYHIKQQEFILKEKWWYKLPFILIKIKVHKSYKKLLRKFNLKNFKYKSYL